MEPKQRRKRSKEKVIVHCAICGKDKIVNPSRIKEGKRFFCGPEHQHLSQIGRRLSEESRKKISEKKTVQRETRKCVGCGKEFQVLPSDPQIYHDRQCSAYHIGKQSHDNIWNKGLPKDDPRIVAKSKKFSDTMKKKYASGEISIWNKGLTAETDERMQKLNEHLTKMRNTEGEWKEMWRESMRRGQVAAWSNGSYDRDITSCEQLTWTYLESLGYVVKHYKDRNEADDQDKTWYFQYPFENAFVPDFAMQSKKWIIEVNGCAMHGHAIDKCKGQCGKYGWTKMAFDNSKRDRRKYSMYFRYGWKWALVWQCEAEAGDFHRIQEYLI